MRHTPINGRQSGGITILVALFLLVLLTISAFAMSKNSLREVVISGTTRQAAEVRNLADSGLEWSMFWMADDRTNARPAPAAGTAAEALRTLKATTDPDTTKTGFPQDLAVTGEMLVHSTPELTRSYDLSVTAMGELGLQGTASNADATRVPGSYNPATLKLWSVRANARTAYTSGQTFLHSRESWFSLLPASPAQ